MEWNGNILDINIQRWEIISVSNPTLRNHFEIHFHIIMEIYSLYMNLTYGDLSISSLMSSKLEPNRQTLLRRASLIKKWVKFWPFRWWHKIHICGDTSHLPSWDLKGRTRKIHQMNLKKCACTFAFSSNSNPKAHFSHTNES